MISKHYSQHIEKRKFYCLGMNNLGEQVGGWVDATRVTSNAFEIVKCDFNCSQGLILEKYINKFKREVIVADTKELAEELFKKACEKGLMPIAKGWKPKHKYQINLDDRYKSLVKQEIIEDKGGYFKIQNDKME